MLLLRFGEASIGERVRPARGGVAVLWFWFHCARGGTYALRIVSEECQQSMAATYSAGISCLVGEGKPFLSSNSTACPIDRSLCIPLADMLRGGGPYGDWLRSGGGPLMY